MYIPAIEDECWKLSGVLANTAVAIFRVSNVWAPMEPLRSIHTYQWRTSERVRNRNIFARILNRIIPKYTAHWTDGTDT
jgi:hypothetical protein